jgi:Tol biopolymer transport system component
MKVSATRALFVLLILGTTFARTLEDAQLVEMVSRMAQIGRASSPSFSADGTRMVLTVSGAAAPPHIWLLEVATLRARQVTQAGDSPSLPSALRSPDTRSGSTCNAESRAGTTVRRAAAHDGSCRLRIRTSELLRGPGDPAG